ncbi:putative F-box protein [Hibiscus syriacus]|uniref:F-box protein n=1 Tax=Hibiscus syriacus TaxID=106335 RepID=A0A6A3BAR5_HIBSY|nr:putative F-box protein [Hibiscus syriacus]
MATVTSQTELQLVVDTVSHTTSAHHSRTPSTHQNRCSNAPTTVAWRIKESFTNVIVKEEFLHHVGVNCYSLRRFLGFFCFNRQPSFASTTRTHMEPGRCTSSSKYGWERECHLPLFTGDSTLFGALRDAIPVFIRHRWLPTQLRPAFFLYFAAPSMASLAWQSIDNDIHGIPFVKPSLIVPLTQVCRPTLFKRSMKRFNVEWWAYSFPLSVLALASMQYAEEVKGSIANLVMLLLSAFSFLVSLGLIIFALLSNISLDDDKCLTR